LIFGFIGPFESFAVPTGAFKELKVPPFAVVAVSAVPGVAAVVPPTFGLGEAMFPFNPAFADRTEVFTPTFGEFADRIALFTPTFGELAERIAVPTPTEPVPEVPGGKFVVAFAPICGFIAPFGVAICPATPFAEAPVRVPGPKLDWVGDVFIGPDILELDIRWFDPTPPFVFIPFALTPVPVLAFVLPPLNGVAKR